MTPVLTFLNTLNHLAVNAKLLADSAQGHGFSNGADLQYLGFGELYPAAALTVCMAALCIAVIHVFLVRPCDQMIRAKAGWIVAGMQHVLAVWNTAVGKSVSLRVCTGAIVADAAVSLCGSSWPNEALVAIGHWFAKKMEKQLVISRKLRPYLSMANNIGIGRVVSGHRRISIAFDVSLVIGVMGLFPFYLSAQPQSSTFNVIPLPDNTPGVIRSWAQKRPSGFYYDWAANPAMGANVRSTWPLVDAAGFLYSDGAGSTQWLTTGGCGIDCMDLTTNQTATGIKTFTNGIIMQGASTAETLQVGASFAITVGADQVELNSTALIIENGTAGQSRAVLGGFDGVGPVVNYGGRIRLYMIDGTTVKAGIGHQDGARFESLNGFTVGGGTVIDGAANAFFLGLTIPTGAAAGLCWTSDAVGLGSWQTCGGGGSFVTTGTNQNSLAGTKEWISDHTHNANIFTGTTNTYDFGTGALAFRTMFAQTGNFDQLEVSDPSSAHATFWRHTVPAGLSGFQYNLTAGSSVLMLRGQVFGVGTHEWSFLGSLVPISVTGADGDIGKPGIGCTQCWRDGYFTGAVNAANFYASTGFFVGTSGAETTELTAGQLTLKNYAGVATDGNVIGGFDGVGPVVNWSGRIRSYKVDGVTIKAGIGHLDSSKWEAINGYSVGGTTVIDGSRNAIFTTIQMTNSPSAGYVLTSDASGNGTWQAPASGTFVTTSTNQTSLSGTKQWTNTHTFDGGIIVKLSSTARNWLPESASAYTLGDGVSKWLAVHADDFYATNAYNIGTQMKLETAQITFSNSTPLPRVILGGFDGVGPVVNYGGRIRLYKIDGTTVKAGIGHLDSSLWESINGYSVAGVTRIDSLGSGLFAGLSASGALSVTGASTLTGGLTTASATVTGLIVNTGAAVVGNCWTATSTGGAGAWQTCGAGAFVTTNTNQLSGLTGDKFWSGSHTFNANIQTKSINPVTTNASNLGSFGSSQWFSVATLNAYVGTSGKAHFEFADGSSGASITQSIIDTANGNAGVISAAGAAAGGIVRVNVSGVFKAEMTGATGFDTSLPYRYNGTAGITGPTVLNVRNSGGGGSCTITIAGGLVTASTC